MPVAPRLDDYRPTTKQYQQDFHLEPADMIILTCMHELIRFRRFKVIHLVITNNDAIWNYNNKYIY